MRGVMATALLTVASVTLAADDDSIEVEDASVLLEPQILRLELDEDELDNENFEIGLYIGRISVEDFGVNNAISASLAFHISEDFFAEVNYGDSSLRPPLEQSFVGAVTFSNELDYRYYNFSVGAHILPGEVFIWRDWAFNSQVFLVGGVGVTEHYLGAKDTTYNLGVGYRLILTDWLALRAELYDHVFSRDAEVAEALAENKQRLVHNIEFRAGVSLFF